MKARAGLVLAVSLAAGMLGAASCNADPVGDAAASPGTGRSLPRPSETRPTPTPAPAGVKQPDIRTLASRTALSFSGEQTQGGWIRGTVPADVIALAMDGIPVEIGEDRAFFIAFDRDAGPSARLIARREDGTSITRDISISPRGWKIEHINAARRRSGPSEAFMALRRPELARINAARSLDTGSEGWRQKFIWPVRGRISGLFGSQRIYRGEPGSYHSGVDIATGASGTPFVAPADGTVILAADRPFTLEGNLLMIDHGAGLNSAFLHCSQLLVKEGDKVKQGQVIGRIGSTGRATGPHLHWGMKWKSARIDPLLLAGPMR